MVSPPPLSSFEIIFCHCVPDYEERKVVMEALRNRDQRCTRRSRKHLVFTGNGYGKRSLQWLIHATFGGYVEDETLVLGSVVISIGDVDDASKLATPHFIHFTTPSIRESLPGVHGKRRCVTVNFCMRHKDELHRLIDG